MILVDKTVSAFNTIVELSKANGKDASGWALMPTGHLHSAWKWIPSKRFTFQYNSIEKVKLNKKKTWALKKTVTALNRGIAQFCMHTTCILHNSKFCI